MKKAILILTFLFLLAANLYSQQYCDFIYHVQDPYCQNGMVGAEVYLYHYGELIGFQYTNDEGVAVFHEVEVNTYYDVYSDYTSAGCMHFYHSDIYFSSSNCDEPYWFGVCLPYPCSDSFGKNGNNGLSQNFPNPFNPSTEISYTVASPGLVKITIFDLLGREVKTLVNEYKDAGKYSVNFDGSSLSSGIYIYKMEAGNFRDVKKMLLVK